MGLFSGIINELTGGSRKAAKKNQQAADEYRKATDFEPYSMQLPGGSIEWNGQNVVGRMSPESIQARAQMLNMGAGLNDQGYGMLRGLGDSVAMGGINDYLAGAMNRFNTEGGDPNAYGIFNRGMQGLQNASRFQDPALSNQFMQAGQGMMGAMGNFNVNQNAQDYTNLLRNQAQTGEQRAVDSTVQRLFNSGRLGSSGGANILGDLSRAQQEADIGRQIAGREYAGAEQNRLAGLATGLTSQGMGLAQGQDALYGNAFNRAQAGSDQLFNQQNMRAQNRFQNYMSLFGAGQQNIESQMRAGMGAIGLGGGLISGAQQFDQNLMNQIMMGANLGAMKSGVNQGAYAPHLEATTARNNVAGSRWTSLAQGFESDARYMNDSALDAFGSFMGGMGGMMGMSDRRLKKDIKPVTMDERNGLTVYDFRYIWESDDAPLHTGYMADEVEKLYPSAVVEFHGYKAVNYGILF